MVGANPGEVNRLPTLIVALTLGCGGREVPRAADTLIASILADLEPAAFPALPPAVRSDLEVRACRVPQSFPDSIPHNVVRGRFTDSSQMDIAVLCLARDTARILVYRGERADDVAELAPAPATDYRQSVAGGDMTFSRAIGVATAEFIRARHERYGGPTLPTLNHEGVNDIFVGKASIVWYWHGDRWLQLPGSD